MMHVGCRTWDDVRGAYSDMICRTATAQTGIGESKRKAMNDMIAWTNAEGKPKSQEARNVFTSLRFAGRSRVSAISSPLACFGEMFT